MIESESMESPQRINENELDWDDDVSVFHGIPYTGIAFSTYPNGALKREFPYRDGFHEGHCREWFENGFLKREWISKRGRAEGEIREWHPTGTIKSIGIYEFGAEIEFTEWSPSETIILRRKLDENSVVAKYVRQMRRRDQ